jgi:hypothetical protein
MRFNPAHCAQDVQLPLPSEQHCESVPGLLYFFPASHLQLPELPG